MALVVVAVVPLLALIMFSVQRQNEREREVRLAEALDHARQIALRIDDELGRLDGILVSLARAVSPNPADIARNEELFVAVRADLGPHVLNVKAQVSDGATLGSSTRDKEPAPEGQAYINETMGRAGLTVGEPRESATAGTWALILARPLPGPDGKPAGIVGVTLDLKRLGPLLTDEEWSHLPVLPEDAVVSVLTTAGVTVARTRGPEQWPGSSYLGNPVISEALAAREGAREFTNNIGQKRLAGFSMCHRAPWLVYARVPSEAAFAEARAKLRNAVWWSGGSLALALGLAWLISTRITRPIRQLAADAAALGGGARLQLTEVASRGEVGVLARSFNQMLARLEERDVEMLQLNESLRRRVAELQTLFDLLPVGVGIATDASGHDIRMNRALAGMFGLPPDRNASLTAAAGGAPRNYRVRQNGRELRPEELPIQRAIAANSAVTDFEHTIVRDDGVELDVLLNAVPLRDADGKVCGCVATFQDLAARK